MPRIARVKSSTSLYHIILRGINRENIFYDTKDREKFIEIMKKFKNINGYEIYGYCLMSNHVHLLIKELDDSISASMKKISASYVLWFNKKHKRSGHLFQNRFRSEAVEDDKYLLTVLRYIHQNPIKATIVEKITDYKWSSYKDYIKQINDLVNTGFVLNLFRKENNQSILNFQDFMEMPNNDNCLDDEIGRRQKITDEEIKNLLKQFTDIENLLSKNVKNKKERDSLIKDLKSRGATIRQLQRITGIGRKIIEKA